MKRKRLNHEDYEGLQTEVFELWQSGMKLAAIEELLGLPPNKCSELMRHYEPYRKILAEKREEAAKEKELIRPQVIQMTHDGFSTTQIAEKLRVSYKMVANIRIEEGLQQAPKKHEYHIVPTVRIQLTTDDVEVFRRVIMVGDKLKTNLEGNKGVVTAKHKWYADISSANEDESYGIPWNWLCACNREVIGR